MRKLPDLRLNAIFEYLQCALILNNPKYTSFFTPRRKNETSSVLFTNITTMKQNK